MSGRRAEIVGAGPGGLSAAIALARRGWSVRVHERMETMRAVGSGFSIFENGLRVLEALGAYERVVAPAHRGTIRETRDARNRVTSRYRHDLGRGCRMIEVTREHLMTSLIETAREAQVDIALGSNVVSAEPAGAIRLEDGTVLGCDLVVAADGIHSRIRESLRIPYRRRPLADGAIRVLVPRLASEVASEDGNKTIEWWSGTRRVLAVPCSVDILYVALTCLESDRAGRSFPLDTGSWTRTFPFLGELFRRLGEGGPWHRFEVVRLNRWAAGRVAFVGDAAHAMAPNLGQGGACAMMGGLALAVALERADGIEAGLAAWEARERPLIDHTQRLSTFYSGLTTWPAIARSAVFWLAANSKWMARQRTRTVLHAPTGTAQ